MQFSYFWPEFTEGYHIQVVTFTSFTVLFSAMLMLNYFSILFKFLVIIE